MSMNVSPKILKYYFIYRRSANNRSKIVCCFVKVAQAPERLTVENDLINTPSSAMINRRRRDFQPRIFTANFQTTRFLYLRDFWYETIEVGYVFG
jgi:hypothetical protein